MPDYPVVWITDAKVKPTWLGRHAFQEDTHVILVPPHASTRTRLHELGHAELEHRGWANTINELTDREISADRWAADKMGKKYSFNQFLVLASEVVEELSSRRVFRVGSIYSYMLRVAAKHNLVLTKSQKSALWNHIKFAWKKHKEQE